MKLWLLPVVALTVLLSGCLTPEEQRAADEQRCRDYGFKKRNDAFAECLQRLARGIGTAPMSTVSLAAA